MTEVERIHEELAPLLPLPEGPGPDWDDVLRRARATRRRPRLLLLAAVVAVAAVAVSPLRATIVGGFSSWLSSSPGAPASPAEQRAFQEANARSWAGFPTGTQLRRLLETDVAGTHFTLYGFRSGDALCLRLSAGGVARASTHCAPVHDLQTAEKPALVVAADEPVGAADVPGGSDAFMTTFGIASDGVRRIELHGDDGDHEALVGGNAFLYVDAHPKLGTRVRAVDAVAADGSRVALGFQSSPYGTLDLPAPPKGRLHGPARVERTVTGGTIGWLVAGEQRGRAVPQELLDRLDPIAVHQFAAPGQPAKEPVHLLVARMIEPDPGSPVRVVVAGLSPGDSMRDPGSEVCRFLVAGDTMGGGCTRLAQTFARQPLGGVGIGGSGPSQYSRIDGLVSDDVERVGLYLGDGSELDAPLRDNVFLAQVARSDFPVRVVAYDGAGRAIGVQDFPSDGMTSPAPLRARKTVHRIARLSGPGGATVTVEAGEAVGGYRCWNIGLSDGAGEGGCTPWPVEPVAGKPLAYLGLLRSRGDGFLAGPVEAGVASLELRYPDGTTEDVDALDGLVAHPLRAGTSGVLQLTARDAAGAAIGRRGLDVNP